MKNPIRSCWFFQYVFSVLFSMHRRRTALRNCSTEIEQNFRVNFVRNVWSIAFSTSVFVRNLVFPNGRLVKSLAAYSFALSFWSNIIPIAFLQPIFSQIIRRPLPPVSPPLLRAYQLNAISRFEVITPPPAYLVQNHILLFPQLPNQVLGR